MRCGRCKSADLEFKEDGSGRCRACGRVTEAFRPDAIAPPLPVDRAGSGELRAPASLRTAIRARGPGASDLHPAESREADRNLRQHGWERRIVRWTAIATFLAMVGLALFPTALGLFVGPIIHVDNPYVLYLSSSGGVCLLDQVFRLINSGNRAGTVFIIILVDQQPTFRWNFTVPAFTTTDISKPISVSGCQHRAFGIDVADVIPA